MEAEARNFSTGFLTRLNEGVMIRDLDLVTVNLQFCHRHSVLFPVHRKPVNKPILQRFHCQAGFLSR
jgi:hypothetical protein